MIFGILHEKPSQLVFNRLKKHTKITMSNSQGSGIKISKEVVHLIQNLTLQHVATKNATHPNINERSLESGPDS